MKFVDPLAVANRKSSGIVLFAGSQFQGLCPVQADYFVNYNDECFVVADGVDGLPNPDVAARLGAETAIWGYKHIRERPFYWADKRKFLKRIFRSANIAVWQKRREFGFEKGLATTLAVAIVGTHKVWVGTVGDSNVLLYREGLIDVLTLSDTNALGMRRFGLVPHVAVERFLIGDILLLASDGVLRFVSEEQLRFVCESAGDTTNTVTTAVVKLLQTAQENGSTDNMTACIVKKVGLKK